MERRELFLGEYIFFHRLTEAINRMAKAMANFAALTVSIPSISAKHDALMGQTEPMETGGPMELLVESLESLASMGIAICDTTIFFVVHVMVIGIHAEQPARIPFHDHTERMHTAATGT